MNLKISFVLLIVLFAMSGCSVLTDMVASIAPDEGETLPDVTGIDSDLWPVFVEVTKSPDCTLPCWWGLHVAETSLPRVDVFLQQTDFNRAQARTIYADAPRIAYLDGGAYWLVFTERTPELIYIGDIEYYFSFDEDKTLSAISFTMRHPGEWLPEEYNPLALRNVLLNIEGQPIIITASPAHTFRHRFSLYIVYPEHGIQLWYSYDFSAYPNICIDSKNIIELQLDIKIDPEDLVQPDGDVLIPIEDGITFAGITAEEFVQFFREHPDDCLDLTEYNSQ